MTSCSSPYTSVQTLLRMTVTAALCSGVFAQDAPTPAPSPEPAPPASTSPAPGGQNQGGIPGQGQDRNRNQLPGTQDRSQQFPEMQRTFFFSGKVIMDDGTPPPESLTIERVCNGITKPEAYTDSKGRFSFQLGQNNSMMADASTSSGDGIFGSSNPGGRAGIPSSMGGGGRQISERDLIGCELRASLPGFRSDVVSLAGRRSLDNPDVGTIVLHRMAKVDGYTFSATSAFAPKDARKAFEKGKELSKKNKLDPAEKELQKAVTAYPKYAAAWYELGVIYHQQSKIDEARKAYEESIKADEKFITPYAQLARITAGQQKWEESAGFSAKVIRLNPFFSAELYFFNAIANLNINKIEQAEESTREAMKLDVNHKVPRVLALLGVILAQKQDFKGAAENLRAYLKAAPTAGDAEKIREQLSAVEKQLASREN